jgi:hypothetical protein
MHSKNIKTRISIVLNGSKVRGRGLYKLEIESLKNLEVSVIYDDLNKFEDPIIIKVSYGINNWETSI